MKPAKVIQFRPDSRKRDGMRTECHCSKGLDQPGKFAGFAAVVCTLLIVGVVAFEIWRGFQ